MGETRMLAHHPLGAVRWGGRLAASILKGANLIMLSLLALVATLVGIGFGPVVPASVTGGEPGFAAPVVDSVTGGEPGRLP
jgi:hypothetical protein